MVRRVHHTRGTAIEDHAQNLQMLAARLRVFGLKDVRARNDEPFDS